MRSRRACCWMIGALLLVSGSVWAGDGQIDIATLPYTISQSGSYVVVADLTLSTLDQIGITITASNVTLDLNGHTVAGPGKEAGTFSAGIYAEAGTSNIAVRNGTSRDWRSHGIHLQNAFNIQVERLRCIENGEYGIVSGDATLATGNTCSNNGGPGLSVTQGGTVTGNVCWGNGAFGLQASRGSTVSGNTCAYNAEDGIIVYDCCRVTDNTSDSNGYLGLGSGILCIGQGNVVRNNLCTNNDRGIDLEDNGSVLSGNICQFNTTPLYAYSGNQLDILISEVPYTILYPGVYRLSGSLTAPNFDDTGITIASDDVTLDLGGHSLIGPGKDVPGIAKGIDVIYSSKNICIRNGTVCDWPYFGIDGWNASNSHFEGLRSTDNGMDGLTLGYGCTATNNVCNANGNYGIEAIEASQIAGNVCSRNLVGIGATSSPVSGCSVVDNTCTENTLDGIAASSGCTVRGNTCSSNGRHGMKVFLSCQVVENTCCQNGSGNEPGAGIWVQELEQGVPTRNVIERNVVTNNEEGIRCNPATGNYIAANRASGNTTMNYDISVTNTQGTGDLANISY